MFALIAFVLFVLALFGVTLGSIDIVVLGFAFMALQLAVGPVIALPRYERKL